MLRLGTALVAAPPFRAGLPRLSEHVVAEYRADGAVVTGSMGRALASGTGAEGSALDAATRLVQERVGGSYWADAPADALLAGATGGLAIVVTTGDDGTDHDMAMRAFARVGAERTLLLCDPSLSPGVRRIAAQAGCRVAVGPLDPWPLLDAATELHVADEAAIAPLALLAGLAVHCHRPTWFSGRGLTTDAAPDIAAPPCELGQLAAAALIDGVRYRDPFTGKPCSVGQAIDFAADWRRVCQANRTIAACVGMQFWKRRRIGQFLHTGVRAPRCFAAAGPAIAAAQREAGAIAGWASRLPASIATQAAAAGVPLVRVEDGFLRSVGLGSDFLPPCSIVLDRSGLYYDPARPSDLETILATAPFPPALEARAHRLMARITQSGLTKYNTGKAALPLMPKGRQVILVPGQVADDLSVKLGGGAASGNADLLQQVRAAHPDAFIVYRPHPDVDAGHRLGAIPDAEALRSADIVSRGASMGALIGAVDAVHTMTSLAGFEALLRGRHVVAWGRPFYAGWGLTEDMSPIPRRTRKLRLEQLAAGVLLLYPRYLDPVTLLPCPAEVLIDRLDSPDLWRTGPLVRLRQWQGRLVEWWGRAVAPGRRA